MSLAEAATPAPVKKKPNVSTFRRLLWHVNRTDLGWVVKGALRTVNFRDLATRRSFVKELPSSTILSSKAAQLSDLGFVEVTDAVSRDLAQAVATHSHAKVARADELAASQQLGHKSFWVSLLDEDLVNGQFPTDHPFVRYAMQPAILSILAKHMGTLPQLSDVLLTLSRPMTDEKLTYSQLWHHDHDDKRVCKLFIYLTDVRNTADGPFTFLDSKASAPFRNTLKSHMADDAVLAKAGPQAVREMIAPQLTSFIVDTAKCLHMGSRIKSGHSRLLYTATFFPPPRIYPEPPARFYAKGELSALERAVLAL
jgi:hypothetical protein